MKTKCLFVSLAVFVFVFFAFEANAGVFQFSETDPKYLQALSIAAAQEAQDDVDIEKKLELDEDLKPEDFGLTDIGTLPTSPFYFIKGIRRGLGSVFTRDPVKKTELKLKYAAEKLLEAKEVAQKEDASDKEKKYAIENFKDELEEVKHRVEVASESLEGDEAKELSRKVLDATMKYGKSLGNIEKNISPEIFNSVKEAKDTSSEVLVSTFGLTEPGIVSNQIVEVLDKQVGSEFKDFKNLEVLKEVEGKVPEKAKEAIRIAQDNALNRLQTELERFESAKRALFEEFVKSAGGSEIRHLEIINDLESRPISKDLRDIISRAKEQVFSKAESRLNGLSQENKEKFVEHLGEGNLEDFRILKELENNIDSGVISGISKVVSRAETEFVKKIESTGQDEVQKKEFLGSIERFHDAKSISVLNEIEKLIPDDKKSFFAELKSKAVQEINNDIGRATNSSQRQSVYDSLAGDHPEDLAALDKFQGTVRSPFDADAFIEGIKRTQYRAMQDKIENISDKERLAKYEEEFKKLRQEIPDYSRFNRIFQERKDIFESPERAAKKIEEAEKAVAEFKGVRATLPYDSGFKGGEFDQMLRDIESILAHAERRLETAHLVLSYNDVGRAFDEAQSAENMARNGIALANKYKSGTKETKCPFYFSPPPRFCENGVVIHQNDQNGCPLPPRCEFKEIRECPAIDYSAQTTCPAGTHRESFKDDKGCYILGKCVADRVTCQAYFEGYVFDKNTNSCRKEGGEGCNDPFVYHTLEECTKANSKPTICPLMPTVNECPVGERKVATFSSPECGTYYVCEKEGGATDYCGDKICQSNEYGGLCTQDCQGDLNTNWMSHVWNFSDGTINSMILNRIDSEYTSFISGIQAQCVKTSKNKFAWKPDAGNDAPDNWQNFGIPDCSGTVVSYVCGNNVCDQGETSTSCPADCGGVGPSCGNYTTSATCEASPACDWLGSSCVPTITTMICNNNKICDYNESQTSCPSDCISTTARCTYFTEATCNADTICAWVGGFGCGSKAQCNDKTDNDGDGLVDMTDSGCSDNFDNDESGGATTMLYEDSQGLCSDNIDNDKDGFTDLADPSCSAFTTTVKPQCSDGKDNDGDAFIDYPSDTGCYSSTDNDETAPVATTCATASTCTDSATCAASGFYWYNNVCNTSSQTTTTACNNNSVCDSNEYYSTCPSDCGSAPTGFCSSKTDSSSCTATSGCEWAGTYCYYGSSGGSTTSCVSCQVPSSGCWYEGGSCSSCGTIKCTTTSGGSGSVCMYTTEATCANDSVCSWVPGFGCGSKAQCNDKTDNDSDGLIDMADSGCYENFDNSESS